MSPAENARKQYELDVLRTTVLRNVPKGKAMRELITWAYDRVLAERIANVSTTMR
jgi:hypothetical protein